MMQTIEFVNATLENTGSVGSTDITSIISLFISIVAAFIAFGALYFAHLRGMSISSVWKCELPELSGGDFKGDAPTELLVKVTLSVLNSGNRAGIVDDLKLEFNPQPDFKEFLRDKGVKWYSIRSAKTNQPAPPIFIKDRDTDLVIFGGYINLDWGISMRRHLRTIDIESDNLKTLLEKMLDYKKELLRKFINFLKKNEKLGDLIISYSYTTERIRRKHIVLPSSSIEYLKRENEKLEVTHSYKKTIEWYEDSLKNYQLYLYPKEIINAILRSIKRLKKEFDSYSEEIKKHPTEDIFGLPLSSEWINKILNEEEEDFELLSKCRNYGKTIEDIKSLLKNSLIFNQKVREANAAPTEKLRQSLKEEIKKEIEELGKKLKEISPKLEELKKEVEHELS